MQNAINTVCDFCSDVLEGKSGTAQMHKPYLSIKGAICLVEYDKETSHTNYTYVAEKRDIDKYFHFCSDLKKNCLLEYIKARQVLRREWQQSQIDDTDNYHKTLAGY